MFFAKTLIAGLALASTTFAAPYPSGGHHVSSIAVRQPHAWAEPATVHGLSRRMAQTWRQAANAVKSSSRVAGNVAVGYVVGSRNRGGGNTITNQGGSASSSSKETKGFIVNQDNNQPQPGGDNSSNKGRQK